MRPRALYRSGKRLSIKGSSPYIGQYRFRTQVMRQNPTKAYRQVKRQASRDFRTAGRAAISGAKLYGGRQYYNRSKPAGRPHGTYHSFKSQHYGRQAAAYRGYATNKYGKGVAIGAAAGVVGYGAYRGVKAIHNRRVRRDYKGRFAGSY